MVDVTAKGMMKYNFLSQ